MIASARVCLAPVRHGAGRLDRTRRCGRVTASESPPAVTRDVHPPAPGRVVPGSDRAVAAGSDERLIVPGAGTHSVTDATASRELCGRVIHTRSRTTAALIAFVVSRARSRRDLGLPRQ